MKGIYYDKVEKLVIKAQKGDKEAFSELYHLTAQGVYFYALQLSKNEELAQDITQEVYLDLVDSVGELNFPRTFVSWINKRTYFISLNYLRKEKRNYNLGDENVLVDNIVDENESSSPLYSYLKNEKQEILMEAIDTLSPNHKSVLLLKYYQGLSLEDIALSMDCSVGTVKSRLSRAKDYLKETLNNSKVGKGLLGLVFLPNLREVFAKVSSENPLSSTQVLGIASSVGLGGLAATGASGGLGLTMGSAVLSLSILGLGVIGGSFLLTGLESSEVPMIISVIADNPLNYTKENIEVIIEVENKNSVKEILLVGENGKSYAIISEEGNTYRSYVDANGTYQVKVSNGKGQENKSSFNIDKIDKDHPSLVNTTVIGEEIFLQMADTTSKIDWNKTTILKTGTNRVEPVSIDQETNTLKLEYLEDALTIIIYDQAGNNTTYERMF